jgi:hypothetical protein
LARNGRHKKISLGEVGHCLLAQGLWRIRSVGSDKYEQEFVMQVAVEARK